MAAAVVLLVAAVLLHFATPHHAASSHTVSAMALAIESEPRKSSGSACAQSQAGTGSAHVGTAADSPALPPRTDHLVEAPPLVAGTWAGKAAIELDAPPRAAHPRTARDTWSPASALAPDATVLQTFRR
ncbi:hypothetical protein [Streptomyces albiflavescens]|nr:hypothetical protein [Streptomyces albiflavescens]